MTNCKLDMLVALKQRAAVYVPSTINHENGTTEYIDNSEIVRGTARKMAAIFGGATAQKSTGYWVSDSTGKLVEEATTIVYSNAAYIGDNETAQIIEIAQQLKNDLKQDAVSIEINNTLYLV